MCYSLDKACFTEMVGLVQTFHGYQGENAREFLDNLEMTYLILGCDQEEVKLRAFPLVLKGEACTWYEGLNVQERGTSGSPTSAFKTKDGGRKTLEKLWRQLLEHEQMHLNDFSTYETTFKTLWERLVASFEDHGIALDFLKRERLIVGLLLELCEKVEARYPHTFDETLQIATQKFQKVMLQSETV